MPGMVCRMKDLRHMRELSDKSGASRFLLRIHSDLVAKLNKVWADEYRSPMDGDVDYSRRDDGDYVVSWQDGDYWVSLLLCCFCVVTSIVLITALCDSGGPHVHANGNAGALP